MYHGKCGQAITLNMSNSVFPTCNGCSLLKSISHVCVFFILSTSARNMCILLTHAWSIVNLMSSDEAKNKLEVYFILFMSTFSLMFISKFGQRNVLRQGSSTRGPLAACGPRASFVRPGKSISQNAMRYEY